MLKRLTLALVALAIAYGTAAAQSLSSPSSWINQRTSILSIWSVDGTGNFSGLFTNRASGFQCQDTFPATGSIRGNRVRIVVNFKNLSIDCRTVTTWRGILRGNQIATEWVLVYTNSAGRQEIYRGRDTFTRQ